MQRLYSSFDAVPTFEGHETMHAEDLNYSINGADRGPGSANDRHCHNCSFKARCLPAELDGEQLTAFERAITRQTQPIKSGEILVRQGDPMRHLYALRIGSLKAQINGPDGVERVVGFRFSGSLIGLAEPEQKQWARTFVALEDAWVCRIPVETLDDTLRRQLVKLMSERLRGEYEYHLSMASKSRVEKVASFLVDISNERRRRNFGSQHFDLPMNNLDLASYLGMRHESLSRTFAELQRRGLMKKSGKRVELERPDELRKLISP